MNAVALWPLPGCFVASGQQTQHQWLLEALTLLLLLLLALAVVGQGQGLELELEPELELELVMVLVWVVRDLLGHMCVCVL